MRSDTHNTDLKLCSWNIGGILDKFLKEAVLKYILEFDAVWILELKTGTDIQIPGFCVFRNIDETCPHRGGIALLVKNYLQPYIDQVDITTPGQIWLGLRCAPNYSMGGCYIPPTDSPYFDLAHFGYLQSRLMLNYERGVYSVVLGDFNARVWGHRGVNYQHVASGVHYPQQQPDNVTNVNGQRLMQVCADTECVIANHCVSSGVALGGGLSYRKTKTWISEIDLCLTSKTALKCVQDIKVNQDLSLPSDHAPLEVRILCRGSTNRLCLLQRSADLGEHISKPAVRSLKKGLPCNRVNTTRFQELLQDVTLPDYSIPDDIDTRIDTHVAWVTNTLNNVARKARLPSGHTGTQWDVTQPRWARLLACGDMRKIWKSIGWNGSLDNDLKTENPTDEEFKEHFEALLKPEVAEIHTDTTNAPYIPCLDDPIDVMEVDQSIRRMKNSGYIGAAAGLFKWIPATMLIFITHLFNSIFMSSSYPADWIYSKLVTLFKRGSRLACGNYRGIAVSDSLSKLFDTILNSRLKQWISVDKAQAGAQKGRGCLEQILSLRLLIDLCKTRKDKLFIIYVDFQKAYDKVPRQKLLDCLRERGCGARMYLAIAAMYKCTKYILRSAVISASVGVRQGAVTSCLLFVFYVDFLVTRMKATYQQDGFLGSLHLLLLMDDTVILATSRNAAIRKFTVLLDYCHDFGMIVNAKKTKLMVINGNTEDKAPIYIRDLLVDYAEHYIYLGGHFTDDGKMSSVLELHARDCARHANKFAAFAHRNPSMPYVMKKQVFDAAILSANAIWM